MLRELLPLLLPLSLTLAGAILTALGALRTPPSYPSCVRCAHNLSWIVGATARCPECGVTLRGGRFRPANKRAAGWESARTAGVATLCLSGLLLSIVAAVQFV